MRTTLEIAPRVKVESPLGSGAIVPLLFGSGACALVYQTVWQREFRLIFGSSTAASAAVLAIFICGLGAGSFLLGKRADRSSNPLRLYSTLEAAIALLAGASPFLLGLAKTLYLLAAGTFALSLAGSSVLRLVLASLVLLPATLLMGGTLPAAARAFELGTDAGRGRVALLYAVNTLGSVIGALAATFFLLEALGARNTLWLACLLNLSVALGAWIVSARTVPEKELPDEGSAPAAPLAFTLGASALAGFVFFLMEIVWYRMLGPLLGGTVFTFGLILAIVLLGIGVGGLLYFAFLGKHRASPGALAITSLLEAVCIAYPFALGDRLAVLAALLRPWGDHGFYALVAGWSVIAFITVFPAAVMAGIQFPLLISLLGRGRERVGAQIGLVYAFNTAGAMAGSLAGGFGLLPLLTAPVCWQLAALLIGLLGVLSLAFVHEKKRLIPAGLLTLLALLMIFGAEGPSSAWRHSYLSAKAAADETFATARDIQAWKRMRRHAIAWEAEGVESSVALDDDSGNAFVLNGKVDGNARYDADMQVMGGLVGAILHPNPKQSLVIGLGTGSTAGWLGKVPSMQNVDVVELEPSILRVADACTPVNEDALRNPIIHTTIGDAREVLLTTRKRYDIVFSEPSNPYRAGVASLFTREYYHAVANLLLPRGVFLQWVQTYDIDPATFNNITATLTSEFPSVEAWKMNQSDILFLASKTPVQFDARELRKRVASEPFRSALANTWRVTSLEGFLAHYLAGRLAISHLALEPTASINTDDNNVVEFGFARAVTAKTSINVNEVFQFSERPRFSPESQGDIDWPLFEREKTEIEPAGGIGLITPSTWPVDLQQETRLAALNEMINGDFAVGLSIWARQSGEPATLTEYVDLAEAAADAGDERAEQFLGTVRQWQPIEADVILARLRFRQGRKEESAELLSKALVAYRKNPWPAPPIMLHALSNVEWLSRSDRRFAQQFYGVLSLPFAVSMFNSQRELLRTLVGFELGPSECTKAMLELEPNVPWHENWLGLRKRCYTAAGHPLAKTAESEWTEFLEEGR